MKKKAKVSLIIPALVPTLAVTFAAISMLLSSSAVGQMRPDCLAEPSKPGACFFTAPTDGLIVSCEDGAVLTLSAPDAEREMGRVNPNGTIAVYTTARIVSAVACRTEDIISGLCQTPEDPDVFLGDASLQVNGFITGEGNSSCPFKGTIKGTFFRDVGLGPEEVEVDAVLQLVKDTDSENPTGCRVLQCRIFAPTEGM
jgi:hypothetical protein